MSRKKQNIGIKELFREKLENEELIPDASVRNELMRKVGRKEFLRFNPARINIFYIGVVLVAGIVTALILSSDPSKRDDKKSLLPLKNKTQSFDTNEIYLPYKQPVDQKADSHITITAKQGTDRDNSLPATNNTDKNTEKRILQNQNEITRPNVGDFFSGQGLITDEDSDKNKLQGRTTKVTGLIETSLTEGCTPLKIKFNNNSASFDSCRWSFGDGGYSNAKDPEWIFDVDGEYKVNLTVYNANSSPITSSVVITVHPRPSARFEISQVETDQPEKEVRFINYSSDAVKFKWSFGDGNSSEFFEPQYRYAKSGNYNVKLVASSDYGCTDSLIVMNAFTGYHYFVSFPNAFIPNPGGPTGGYYSQKTDESAQVFHPVFSGVSVYQLKIFSKLGILIFESNDINVGWDGYFKGQLSEPGVYIWKVRGSFLNGEPFIQMGDVIILKN